MKTPGIILIAIGLILMIYTGFDYVTTKKVVDIGSIQVNQKENHSVEWSPLVGGILIIGGIVILAFEKQTNI
jgi:hypothetical protein